MKAKPGTYVLLLRSGDHTAVQVGRWGLMTIRPGFYIYVGSAFGPGGVRARVSRHCRKTKRMHWHIDYLREAATLESIWYSHRPTRLEHRWAKALAKLNHGEAVNGFGCSDCGCESHLFHFERAPSLREFSVAVGCTVESYKCEKIFAKAWL
jgi:Uri superfamily endonuclease